MLKDRGLKIANSMEMIQTPDTELDEDPEEKTD